MAKKRTIVSAALVLAVLAGRAEETDSLTHDMQTVVVTQEAATTSLHFSRDNTIRFDTDFMQTLPLIMGNADPIHYAQLLPGVQTSTELDAGIHIQGSDNTHNLFSIQGTPVYNASHMLGFFSVYNEAHYAAMDLSTTPQHGSAPARLGGNLNMSLRSQHPDSLHFEASVGLMSSQGTLQLPLGSKSSLTLSGRATYINLLYSPWLRMEDFILRYSFYDANATWLWTPTSRDRVWVDAFYSRDFVKTAHAGYKSDNLIRWGNHAASVHWQHRHSDDLSFSHNLFNTRYHNRFEKAFATNSYTLPSSIMDYGYQGSLDFGRWSFGIEATYHDIMPQTTRDEGIFGNGGLPLEHQNTEEFSVTMDYAQPLIPRLQANLGLRATAYWDNEREWHKALDPSLQLVFTPGMWKLTAAYALRHQFLYLTGPSSLGLPVEFWASSNNQTPPMWGHFANLTAVRFLLGGKYRASAEMWYKRLYNQYETDGDILGTIDPNFDRLAHTLHADGHNYGFSLMMQKCTGPVTGWLSYTYSRAVRHFDHPDYPGVYPASHERPHELNAVVSWRINPRWQASATYVFASGTPYTAAEYFYFVGGQMIVEYGQFNAHRTRPYRRLDLSANYRLRPTRRIHEHGLNFSLYNATASTNELVQRLNVIDGKYSYSYYAIIQFPLPSISYFIRL